MSDISYGKYLRLGEILSAQAPESRKAGRDAHDEMLFIIVHQAYELWFKQILHELDRIQDEFAATPLDDRRLARIVHGLGRIHEILKLLVHQLDVLETMTPQDFLDFRDLLTSSSGFQSLQFRLIETRLGLERARRLLFDGRTPHEHLSAHERTQLEAAEARPSLSDQLDRWLARTPFVAAGDYAFSDAYREAVLTMLAADQKTAAAAATIDADRRTAEVEALERAARAFRAIFEPSAAPGAWRMSAKAVIAALFITVYRDRPALAMPHSVLASLMDIDETMTLWRYRHALMVERMIGVKVGTGGSSGHDYLKRSAETHRVFVDLFHLSTYLIPRRALPELPAEIERRLRFVYEEEEPGR